MCGRTACTLPGHRMVQACTYRGGRKVEEKENRKVKENENSDQAGEQETVICPVWREAPCGGQYRPSPNVPPTSYTPVLHCDRETGQLVLQPMLWGLVPAWHGGPGATSHGLSTNNARLEGVEESKLYKGSLARRRCVVVCDGFYEWQREGGTKQPYLVYRKQEEGVKIEDCAELGEGEGPWQGPSLLYMAGLYSVWPGGEGGPVYSYTIFTRESSPIFSWLHHRMPCFLSPDQVSSWLAPTSSWQEAVGLLHLPREGDLAWHTVSREVGNVRNQERGLVNMVEKGIIEKKVDKTVSAASKGVMANWLKRGSVGTNSTEQSKKQKSS